MKNHIFLLTILVVLVAAALVVGCTSVLGTPVVVPTMGVERFTGPEPADWLSVTGMVKFQGYSISQDGQLVVMAGPGHRFRISPLKNKEDSFEFSMVGSAASEETVPMGGIRKVTLSGWSFLVKRAPDGWLFALP